MKKILSALVIGGLSASDVCFCADDIQSLALRNKDFARLELKHKVGARNRNSSMRKIKRRVRSLKRDPDVQAAAWLMGSASVVAGAGVLGYYFGPKAFGLINSRIQSLGRYLMTLDNPIVKDMGKQLIDNIDKLGPAVPNVSAPIAEETGKLVAKRFSGLRSFLSKVRGVGGVAAIGSVAAVAYQKYKSSEEIKRLGDVGPKLQEFREEVKKINACGNDSKDGNSSLNSEHYLKGIKEIYEKGKALIKIIDDKRKFVSSNKRVAGLYDKAKRSVQAVLLKEAVKELKKIESGVTWKGFKSSLQREMGNSKDLAIAFKEDCVNWKSLPDALRKDWESRGSLVDFLKKCCGDIKNARDFKNLKVLENLRTAIGETKIYTKLKEQKNDRNLINKCKFNQNVKTRETVVKLMESVLAEVKKTEKWAEAFFHYCSEAQVFNSLEVLNDEKMKLNLESSDKPGDSFFKVGKKLSKLNNDLKKIRNGEEYKEGLACKRNKEYYEKLEHDLVQLLIAHCEKGISFDRKILDNDVLNGIEQMLKILIGEDENTKSDEEQWSDDEQKKEEGQRYGYKLNNSEKRKVESLYIEFADLNSRYSEHKDTISKCKPIDDIIVELRDLVGQENLDVDCILNELDALEENKKILDENGDKLFKWKKEETYTKCKKVIAEVKTIINKLPESKKEQVSKKCGEVESVWSKELSTSNSDSSSKGESSIINRIFDFNSSSKGESSNTINSSSSFSDLSEGSNCTIMPIEIHQTVDPEVFQDGFKIEDLIHFKSKALKGKNSQYGFTKDDLSKFKSNLLEQDEDDDVKTLIGNDSLTVSNVDDDAKTVSGPDVWDMTQNILQRNISSRNFLRDSSLNNLLRINGSRNESSNVTIRSGNYLSSLGMNSYFSNSSSFVSESKRLK